jgi:membrane-associated protein
MDRFLEIFRDLPKFLEGFVQDHGPWVYALLFAIIFVETGLVIMPFLPGDSLLFTVGALAAPGENRGPILNLWWSLGLLTFAAILGDAVNYHLGKAIGPRVFRSEPGKDASRFERMLNRKHLQKAHDFFEKYGGKAVILGRFVPIVRTFVPFVAGAGAMNYSKFALYNVTGAIIWVGVCVMAGWWFGNIPWVRKNFEAVVIGIIVVSILPVVVEVWMEKRKARVA